MTGRIELTIDECEFVSEPELRRQIYAIAPDLNDEHYLLDLLYDLISSQVDVVLAWKHRGYTNKNKWGSKYDVFLEAYEQFLKDKESYFKYIKEYCDAERIRR